MKIIHRTTNKQPMTYTEEQVTGFADWLFGSAWTKVGKKWYKGWKCGEPGYTLAELLKIYITTTENHI